MCEVIDCMTIIPEMIADSFSVECEVPPMDIMVAYKANRGLASGASGAVSVFFQSKEGKAFIKESMLCENDMMMADEELQDREGESIPKSFLHCFLLSCLASQKFLNFYL